MPSALKAATASPYAPFTEGTAQASTAEEVEALGRGCALGCGFTDETLCTVAWLTLARAADKLAAINIQLTAAWTLAASAGAAAI